MADVFIEHMVSQKPNGKTMLLRLLLGLAVAVVAVLPIFLEMLGVAGVMTFMPATLVAGVWGGWFFSKRLSLEFEYIITNGEMDIDKIMGRNARKRLLSCDCRNFEILAPAKEMGSYKQQQIKTIDVSSSANSEGRWFAIFNGKDGARTMLIFEPNERMLEAFKKFIPGKMQIR